MASMRSIHHILQKRYLVISTMSNINLTCYSKHTAPYSTKKSLAKTDLDDVDRKSQVGFAEVVKENTKSFGNLIVVIGGIGITAMIFYTIVTELFSSKSPNGVYNDALNRCLKDPKIIDALGQPIKAFGEESRRGRRTHVSHAIFTKDGKQHMRMQFYIRGIRKQGTVYLEVEEDASGKYEYKYLFVKLNDIFGNVINLLDKEKNDIAKLNLDDESLYRFS